MEPVQNGQRAPLSRPEAPPPRTSGRSLLPVLVVFVPLVTMIVGIVAFTGRAGLLILGAIATIPAFVMLHYVLWGHWLVKGTRESPPAEEPADE